MGGLRVLFLSFLILVCCSHEVCQAGLTKAVIKMLNKVNENGPYVGLLAPTSSELYKLLGSASFYPDGPFRYVDYAGRRFHIGSIEGKRVIASMTGKGMMNAATLAQLLLTLFDVKSLLHYGIASNADSDLNAGDVAIPESWAHTGLWNWQRYGDGPNDELSLETDGPFTRDIGSLNFSDYNKKTGEEETSDNFLNSVWFQPEDIFPMDGTPETSEQIFWVPVDDTFLDLSKKLEDMQLEGCIHTNTCLPNTPKVVTVKRGSSSNFYLDNAAYRTFLNSKFQVSSADMESAAIALISHQKKLPFIAFRALTDLAGERPQESNGGDDSFASLAVSNCVNVVLEFIKTMDRSMIDSI